jgi:hypothetical protein
MRKIGLMICLVALTAAGCKSNTEVEVGFKTTMKVDAVYNAGKVAVGEVISAKFDVENTGDEPLILSDVKGTCGCTVADWSKDPIAPGEKGFVKARVNTSGFQTGPVTKSITMLSNTTPAQTTVVVKANIIK